MNTVIKVLALALTLCLGAATSMAAPVTFLFTGQVNPSPLTSVTNFGTALSGSYTFESTTPDTFPAPEDSIYTNAVSSLTFSIGSNFTGSASNGDINVRDNGGPGNDSDIYTVRSFGPSANLTPSVGAFIPVFVQLSLFQSISSPDALSSAALPLIPPNPSDFSTTNFIFHLFNPNTSKYAEISGVIDTITLAASNVPAPAASLLLIVGLAIVGLRRKKS